MVADGGHYENLGPVELLRHRVRTAVVVDASGDVSVTSGAMPVPIALGEAIRLAEEELGVTITFSPERLPLDLTPGTGKKLTDDDLLASLNKRLSKSAVITGEIHYPDLGGPDGAMPLPGHEDPGGPRQGPGRREGKHEEGRRARGRPGLRWCEPHRRRVATNAADPDRSAALHRSTRSPLEWVGGRVWGQAEGSVGPSRATR